MTDEREAVARIIYRAMLGSGDDFTRTPEEWADEILRLIALSRTSGPEGWKPIESAPRDGTPILACSVNHDAREVVCWQDGLDSGSFENLIADEPEPEKGWVNNGPIKDRFYANPRWFTHWQPLPAPPATSDAP